jgi:hypothetical protein
MKAWTRFEDWTNLVLGAYLFAVPFLFGMTGEAASSWNAFVVGAVVAVVSVWVLAAPASKAAEWINVVAAGGVVARLPLRARVRRHRGGAVERSHCGRAGDLLRRGGPGTDEQDARPDPGPVVSGTGEWAAFATVAHSPVQRCYVMGFWKEEVSCPRLEA